MLAFSLFVITAFSQTSFAQGLNWEGQTGALLTPFAYTATSPAGFGKPEVAFHYLNTGSVIGNDYQFSVTEGIAKRFEIGYTGALSSSGNSPASPLFSNGFSEFHGKFTVLKENSFKSKWIPAIAVGSIGRVDVQRIASAAGVGPSTNNADFYIVSTKTITQVKGLPFVLSFGEKVTNAQLFGVAGDATSWRGRLFGAAAFVFKAPAKTTLILGSEVVQQPHYAEGLSPHDPITATFPTSLSYFVRVVPNIEGAPMQIDVGVAQLAGTIAPGVNLQARSQVGMGVSYHF